MIALALGAFEDPALVGLMTGVLTLLVLASLVGWALDRRITSGAGRATVENINARIRAWWILSPIFVVSVVTGPLGSIALFSLVSFLALREFAALAPTRPADHPRCSGLLHHHAAAVLPDLDRMVRPLQHPHSGLRFIFLPSARHLRRHRRFLERRPAISGR